jgi:glutathione peroxidase
MRFLFWVALLIPAELMAQSSLYKITLTTINGKNINLSDFGGKKIMVASVSAENLNNGQLAYLDSLQLANPAIIVIAVPAADYKSVNDSATVTQMKNNSSLHIIVTGADVVKKNNGGKQNKLLFWLTSVSANTHFDLDVTTDDQVYIISESGVLYAVLEKGASAGLINQLLKQEDVKQ